MIYSAISKLLDTMKLLGTKKSQPFPRQVEKTLGS